MSCELRAARCADTIGSELALLLTRLLTLLLMLLLTQLTEVDCSYVVSVDLASTFRSELVVVISHPNYQLTHTSLFRLLLRLTNTYVLSDCSIKTFVSLFVLIL